MSRMRILVALALAGTACTADAAPPTLPPASSPTAPAPSFGSSSGPLLAFHSDPAGRDDTYVMTPEGREAVAVTNGLETIAEPLWSPDGTRLVVECCTGAHGQMLLLDGPGADPIELAPDVEGKSAPAWSPDGATIAFESAADGSVYVVDVGGDEPGAPVRLFDGGGPSWSPDGSRLAFFAERDGNLDIYSAASDGADVTRLTEDPAADHSPLWSPAGDRIAFVSERDGDQDVYVMGSDGVAETDVSVDGVLDDFPAWSPDGRTIAFVAYLRGADPLTIGDGDAEIFVVRVNGGRPVAVSGSPAWDGDPAWSPDGRWIAFTRRTSHAEIYLMRPDGSDQRRLRGLAGIANDCCAAWRPSIPSLLGGPNLGARHVPS
jgi:Tol biopolymer transport system component